MKVISFLLIFLFSFSSFAQKGRAEKAKEDSLYSTFEYRTRNDLIIVPVTINERLRVNLALDPHCKTMILFGNRYKRILRISDRRKKKDASDPEQSLSFNNHVRLGPAWDDNVTIVVIPNKDAINFFTGVHGVIGTDILESYNVSLDKKKLMMTIKPAMETSALVNQRSTGNRQ